MNYDKSIDVENLVHRAQHHPVFWSETGKLKAPSKWEIGIRTAELYRPQITLF